MTRQLHPLEKSVAEAIENFRLIDSRKQAPVIATLSGGADSVALLAALTALGYNCVAAHCNFHLRGEESDRDERHARAMAELLGAEIRVTHFDVESYRREHGGSVEMACRELRYAWFEELRTELGAQAVAVAHNSDDNVETFFLNLLRGTSIVGLTGMAPLSRGHIVRPMLEVSRSMIEDYLACRNLPFITDSSNLSNDYRRNRLRNVVLPALCGCFPDADARIAQTMSHLTANEKLYRALLDEKRVEFSAQGGWPINVAELTRLYPDNAAVMLYEWLRPEGLTFTQAADIAGNPVRAGVTFAIEEHTLLLDRGMLLKVSDEKENICSPADMIEIMTVKADEFTPSGSPTEAYFDESVLTEGKPFVIRTWQKGDRMRPFGMRGSKKLSDIFSDAKIPLDAKHRTPIVVHPVTGDILWVAGIRASAHFPVTGSTKRVVVMRMRSF